MSRFTTIVIAFLISCNLGCTTKLPLNNAKPPQLKLQQLLQDEIKTNNSEKSDGLDNARFAAITSNNTTALIVSADDNALAQYDIDENFNLSFKHKVKNNALIDGLIGASDIVISKDNQYAYVTSFYDSALVVFKRNRNGKFEFLQAVRDGIEISAVFTDTASVKAADKDKLRGAYDIALSKNGRNLYIASSASNTIAIYNTTPSGKVVFKQSVNGEKQSKAILKNTVKVSLSPDNRQLASVSFSGNAINIFKRNSAGQLNWHETISIAQSGYEHLKGPLAVAYSPDGEFLYIGLFESDAIMVLQKGKSGYFQLFQTIFASDTNKINLAGTSSIAVTQDGKTIITAAEKAHRLNLFSRTPSGKLIFASQITNADVANNALLGVSSVNLSADQQHLLVTSGEGDSLMVFTIEQ